MNVDEARAAARKVLPVLERAAIETIQRNILREISRGNNSVMYFVEYWDQVSKFWGKPELKGVARQVQIWAQANGYKVYLHDDMNTMLEISW